MAPSSPVTLDATPALIVVDLQKGIVAGPKAHPADAVVAHASRLAAAFRGRGHPVVLVNVAGGAPGRTETPRPSGPRPEGFSDLVDELDAQPGDILVTKQRWGAFSEPSLHATLRDRGVTQVVVCGIATSWGVESTARQAHELGYNVALVVDAMTDMSPEAHEHSVERIFPRIGERATTDDVLAALGVGGGA